MIRDKEFKEIFEAVNSVIDTSRFYADVNLMTDYDITINPAGVDWGVYCSKPNNEGWYEEEDWMPRDGWPVYHLKGDSLAEIEAVVIEYMNEYSH